MTPPLLSSRLSNLTRQVSYSIWTETPGLVLYSPNAKVWALETYLTIKGTLLSKVLGTFSASKTSSSSRGSLVSVFNMKGNFKIHRNVCIWWTSEWSCEVIPFVECNAPSVQQVNMCWISLESQQQLPLGGRCKVLFENGRRECFRISWQKLLCRFLLCRGFCI